MRFLYTLLNVILGSLKFKQQFNISGIIWFRVLHVFINVFSFFSSFFCRWNGLDSFMKNDIFFSKKKIKKKSKEKYSMSVCGVWNWGKNCFLRCWFTFVVLEKNFLFFSHFFSVITLLGVWTFFIPFKSEFLMFIYLDFLLLCSLWSFESKWLMVIAQGFQTFYAHSHTTNYKLYMAFLKEIRIWFI